MMRDNPREVDETADRLRGNTAASRSSAELEYGLGDQMRLVEEDGRWRIATNPLAFYDQSTPKAALRSFIRAYRLERWDIMLRFVPNQYREKMDAAKMKAQFTGASKDSDGHADEHARGQRRRDRSPSAATTRAWRTATSTR